MWHTPHPATSTTASPATGATGGPRRCSSRAPIAVIGHASHCWGLVIVRLLAGRPPNLRRRSCRTHDSDRASGPAPRSRVGRPGPTASPCAGTGSRNPPPVRRPHRDTPSAPRSTFRNRTLRDGVSSCSSTESSLLITAKAWIRSYLTGCDSVERQHRLAKGLFHRSVRGGPILAELFLDPEEVGKDQGTQKITSLAGHDHVTNVRAHPRQPVLELGRAPPSRR